VEDAWPSLTKIDFSWNELTRIDQSIVLTPNLQSLTLDGNQIKKIENTEMLPNLTHLCASANNIVINECLSVKLMNIVQLNLSQNKITKLTPFAMLTKLKDLNLGSNLICESSEFKYVSALPALKYLVLTGNPVSTIIDYRIKVFELFGERAKQLCLDNERPSQKELDTAAVLRALSVVREGKTPISSS
jgi:Leucine-rich repeat (LRR) protein